MTEIVAGLGPVALLALLYGTIKLRGHRKERANRARRTSELRSLAEPVGGQVVDDPERCTPWSHGLRPPFPEHVLASFFSRISILGPPTHTHRVDFIRRGRHVRVTETTIELAGHRRDSSPQEHLIEIAIPAAPGLALAPVLPPDHFRVLGQDRTSVSVQQNLLDKEARSRPADRRETTSWQKVSLDDRYAERFTAYAEEPVFAERVLSPSVLAALVQGHEHIRHTVTMRDGLLYAVAKEPIKDDILSTIDVLVSFLDRIPAKAWKQHAGELPAPAASPRTYPYPNPRAARLVWLSLPIGFVVLMVILLFAGVV
ncbi:hypothetical protein [Saccharomonospora saliphila]|uniref:hypothetical protein n=1 Tax=Saccharomonospora saliphila TaxID=369829 RepID=UPI0003781DBB|nr:hypothetical protein [Saccharomonospora saliphila]